MRMSILLRQLCSRFSKTERPRVFGSASNGRTTQELVVLNGYRYERKSILAKKNVALAFERPVQRIWKSDGPTWSSNVRNFVQDSRHMVAPGANEVRHLVESRSSSDGDDESA